MLMFERRVYEYKVIIKEYLLIFTYSTEKDFFFSEFSQEITGFKVKKGNQTIDVETIISKYDIDMIFEEMEFDLEDEISDIEFRKVFKNYFDKDILDMLKEIE